MACAINWKIAQKSVFDVARIKIVLSGEVSSLFGASKFCSVLQVATRLGSS